MENSIINIRLGVQTDLNGLLELYGELRPNEPILNANESKAA